MGQLIDGVWTTEMPTATATSGRFARPRTVFHGTISAKGSPDHKTEAGCYHLYVAHACPWTHHTTIVHKLKRLEAAISVSVVDPIIGEGGWHFGISGVPSPTASMAHVTCETSTSRRILATPATSPCRCFGTRPNIRS